MSTRRQFETLAYSGSSAQAVSGPAGKLRARWRSSGRSDRMVCGLSAGGLGFVETILVIFDGLLISVSWLMWVGGPRRSVVLQDRRAGAFAGVCWAVFLRNLLGTPRIEIPYSSGDLLFFRCRTATPAFAIPREEIHGLESSEAFEQTRLWAVREVSSSITLDNSFNQRGRFVFNPSRP